MPIRDLFFTTDIVDSVEGKPIKVSAGTKEGHIVIKVRKFEHWPPDKIYSISDLTGDGETLDIPVAFNPAGVKRYLEHLRYKEIKESYTEGYSDKKFAEHVSKEVLYSDFDMMIDMGGDRFFEYLICAESRGDPNAVSGVGAFGLTQIMPDTSKGFGFSVIKGDSIDARKSQIMAGALHLNKMLDITNQEFEKINEVDFDFSKSGGLTPYIAVISYNSVASRISNLVDAIYKDLQNDGPNVEHLENFFTGNGSDAEARAFLNKAGYQTETLNYIPAIRRQSERSSSCMDNWGINGK